MFLQQFFVKGLGHASYLLGDPDAGVGVVIDPRRDIGEYLEAAADEGLSVLHVLETHVHNDYVSGAEELRVRTGATVHAAGLADLSRPHEPMSDGDELRAGSLRITVLATPGHTPDHVSFLVADLSRTDEDWVFFSGGALLVGTAARPDLLGGPDEARRSAAVLFETIRDRIAPLPDWIELYPTHGAGSLCGSGIGGKRWSTVGFERRHNPALNQPDSDAFTRFILEDQPTVPAYWREMRPMNQRGGAPLDDLADPRPMSGAQVQHAVEHGATIIDAREPTECAAGYIPGSISIGLGDTFGSWAGSMVPIDREVVLVLSEPHDLGPALTQLRRAGFDRVIGYLDGGMQAWPGELERLRQVSVDDLPTDERDAILDVREPSEWRDGHIAGAVHIPAAQLPRRLDEVPGGRVVVMCGSGYRSAIAASILQRDGRDEVAHLIGGMGAYREAGLPITVDGPAEPKEMT